MAKGFLSALKGIDAFGKVRPLLKSMFRQTLNHAYATRPRRMSRLRLALVHCVSHPRNDDGTKLTAGGLVTLISACIILAFTTMEFFDYRRVGVDTSIVVDRSRGQKLSVRLNVTFPHVPCYCERPWIPHIPNASDHGYRWLMQCSV